MPCLDTMPSHVWAWVLKSVWNLAKMGRMRRATTSGVNVCVSKSVCQTSPTKALTVQRISFGRARAFAVEFMSKAGLVSMHWRRWSGSSESEDCLESLRLELRFEGSASLKMLSIRCYVNTIEQKCDTLSIYYV